MCYKYTVNHWKHSLHRAYSLFIMHIGNEVYINAQSLFIIHIQSNLTSSYSGQTMGCICFLSVFFHAFGKYTSWQTDWLSLIANWTPIVKRLLSGMNHQTEQFFMQMNTLLSLLMLFFFFFLRGVYVFSSSSIIHYVHNVCYWLLFLPNRFNFMKQMAKWLQMQLNLDM